MCQHKCKGDIDMNECFASSRMFLPCELKVQTAFPVNFLIALRMSGNANECFLLIAAKKMSRDRYAVKDILKIICVLYF